jgi:hypothetical protein
LGKIQGGKWDKNTALKGLNNELRYPVTGRHVIPTKSKGKIPAAVRWNFEKKLKYLFNFSQMALNLLLERGFLIWTAIK